MPATPSSLIEPLWQRFSALLPEPPEFDPAHPLGCHRRRVPDETVFHLVVEALVHAWLLIAFVGVLGMEDRLVRRCRAP